MLLIKTGRVRELKSFISDFSDNALIYGQDKVTGADMSFCALKREVIDGRDVLVLVFELAKEEDNV